MPNAGLLAKTQINHFKRWLEEQGHEWREGRGDYQIIQVQLAGETGWHVVYYRLHNPVHYSVPAPLIPTVDQFLNSKRKKKHATDHHPSPRKQASKGGTEGEARTQPAPQTWFGAVPDPASDDADPDAPF